MLFRSGLGSTEQKGPRRASRLWSQRAGDPTWELSRFPRLEWVVPTPSIPLLLFRSWRPPPACLSCSPLATLLCFQDQRSPEGASESIGPSPRAGQNSPADWVGGTLGALPPIRAPKGSSVHGNPSPLQPPLRGASPVQPPLFLPPESPHILLVRFGVPPVSLGVEVSHQQPAGVLVVGRHVFIQQTHIVYYCLRHCDRC